MVRFLDVTRFYNLAGVLQIKLVHVEKAQAFVCDLIHAHEMFNFESPRLWRPNELCNHHARESKHLLGYLALGYLDGA